MNSIVEQYLRFGKADVSDKYLQILHKTTTGICHRYFRALRQI